MQSLADRDYFSDHGILKDPYAYFEAIRARGPIYQVPSSGMIVITGFDEIIEVITHLAFYSGWPTANTAVAIARRVFDED